LATDTLTVAQLVERTRRHLATVEAAPLNVLSVAVGLSDLTAVMRYELGDIEDNVYIAIDDEILYVWNTDDDRTVTVSRGMLGTSAAAHAVDAIVESPTRFPKPVIKDALQEEVRSWPDSIFRVSSVVGNRVLGTSIIDLGLDNDDLICVLGVDQGPRLTTTSFEDRWSAAKFRLMRMSVAEGVESETAIQITGDYEQTDRTVNVLVGLRFEADTADDGDNVVTEWGVPRTALDIIPFGAAVRLLMGREAVRTEADALMESRVAEQIPPQYLTQTAVAFQRLRDRRLDQEAMRLRGRYPVRMT
jgi:hypothetical protein